MINLLLFADKTKIFGYDLTDRTSPSELSFEGNDSVSFENDTAVKDCIQCIKDKYSVDDLSDDDFDIAVIDCGTKKKYIPEIVNAVQKSRKIGVYSLNKLIVPALINMSKQPEDTIYVSLEDYTYKVYSLDGVYYTDNAKCDEPDIQLNISDLSFVFNFNKPEAAAQAGADPSQIAELNSEIAKLNNKISESEQTIVALRNENAAITEKEAEEPQELPADEYVDNAELKTKLKEIMNEDFPLEEYIISCIVVDKTLNLTVIHNETNYCTSFSVDNTTDEKTALHMLKSSIMDLHHQVVLATTPYALLQKGDTFEFGRYKGQPIIWQVLDNAYGMLEVISDDIICERPYYNDSNSDIQYTDLESWLNGFFYKNCFNDMEKDYISNISSSNSDSDSVAFKILSRDEIKYYIGNNISINNNYWTSSTYEYDRYSKWYVDRNGTCNNTTSSCNIRGVRPYFRLVYDRYTLESSGWSPDMR